MGRQGAGGGWVSVRGTIVQGNARALPFADESVHCCVTSPPYWGLRDYGVDGQLGLEQTPEEYVAEMVAVFGEVRRVLRADGTLWLNLGDSYATGGGAVGRAPGGGEQGERFLRQGHINTQPNRMPIPGLKPKDLAGIPWRVAFALQADGWYLRSDIIWHKPNPMPESVTDRPTKAHEHVFLLTKSARYFYDADAVREVATCSPRPESSRNSGKATKLANTGGNHHKGGALGFNRPENGRNKRTVWTVNSKPYAGAHFATMPPKLVEPCIKAGTSEKGCCAACGAPWVRVVERAADRHNRREGQQQRRRCNGVIGGGTEKVTLGVTGYVRRETTGWQPSCNCATDETAPCIVLDPFGGSGTTVAEAVRLGRNGVAVELNREYIALANERIAKALSEAGAATVDNVPAGQVAQLGLDL